MRSDHLFAFVGNLYLAIRDEMSRKYSVSRNVFFQSFSVSHDPPQPDIHHEGCWISFAQEILLESVKTCIGYTRTSSSRGSNAYRAERRPDGSSRVLNKLFSNKTLVNRAALAGGIPP